MAADVDHIVLPTPVSVEAVVCVGGSSVYPVTGQRERSTDESLQPSGLWREAGDGWRKDTLQPDLVSLGTIRI